MWRRMKTCLSALPAGTSFTEANCMQCVRLIVNGIQVVENCPQTVHILLIQPVEEHAADGHAAIVQDLDGGERVTVRRLHADEIDGAAAQQAAVLAPKLGLCGGLLAAILLWPAG